MKVLIIEDDDVKRKRVSDFLSKDNIEFDIAKSYNSGLRALISDTYSHVILDMSLTTFDITNEDKGGRPLPLGGIDILNQMKRRKISAEVIVLTQYDIFGQDESIQNLAELSKKITDEHKDLCKDVVYFSHQSSDWEDRIAELITGSGK